MKNVNWPWFILLSGVAVCAWAVLFYLNACAPAPRFSNGDYTEAPDVVESDMPGYKP